MKTLRNFWDWVVVFGIHDPFSFLPYSWRMKYLPHCWYCEYDGHNRIHDHISIMVNNFPILVVRRMDNPHSERDDMNRFYMFGIFGYTFVYNKEV